MNASKFSEMEKRLSRKSVYPQSLFEMKKRLGAFSSKYGNALLPIMGRNVPIIMIGMIPILRQHFAGSYIKFVNRKLSA